MVTEWMYVRLGDHCSKIGSGFTPKGGSERYIENGKYALIRSQNVWNDGFKNEGLVLLTDEDAAELKGVSLEAGDILLNITGDSVARCCTVPNEMLPARVNQHVMIVRPVPTILNKKFLRYCLISPSMQDKLFQLASAGATRAALTKSMVEALQIPCPEMKEQRAIAHILGAFDDKIELNRKMNETFEGVAQTIFKSWFIDFDPVKAKAEGRKPTGMSEEIAALFPDNFEDSELGKIPRGWGNRLLKDLAFYLQRGITPCYTDHSPIFVLNQKCIRNHAIDFSMARYHDADKKPVTETKYVIDGDILINSTGVGTLGRIAQAWGILERSTIDSHITSLRPDNSLVAKTYLGYALLNLEDEIEGLGEGSTGQTELSRHRLGAFPILVPSLDIQQKFESIMLPMVHRAVTNRRQNTSLAALRNTLLPKLISGEIRIKDAEKLVSEIARGCR